MTTMTDMQIETAKWTIQELEARNRRLLDKLRAANQRADRAAGVLARAYGVSLRKLDLDAIERDIDQGMWP